MRVNGKRWGQALVVILVLTGLAANAEQTAQGENTQLQTQKLEADIKQLQIELQQLKTTKEVFDEKAKYLNINFSILVSAESLLYNLCQNG
jgi:hypothetical protein